MNNSKGPYSELLDEMVHKYSKKSRLEEKIEVLDKQKLIEYTALVIQETYKKLGKRITNKRAKTEALKFYETQQVINEFTEVKK